MPDHPPSKADIGLLGEDFVASILQEHGWTILHRRWRCRWGELDIIAQQGRGAEVQRCRGEKSFPKSDTPPMPHLIFVEVKTRSLGNWDADGTLAIAKSKQAKLWNAATAFLADYPDLAASPCRFDVACVGYQRISPRIERAIAPGRSPARSVQILGYRFFLQHYIQSAFDN